MAHKLARIKDIHLYTAFSNPESAADCARALKALHDADIQFNVLAYNDHVEGQKSTLEALSTWILGDDGHKVTCSDFPILSWDECFDDFVVNRRIAHGLDEILSSDVLTSGAADTVTK